MEWSVLLSTQKLAEEEPEPEEFKQYPINAFEKDYNEIVSSVVFRRLQDKTQVFPLDKSDFVRTRLTHSIEVSTIARQMGIMISKNTSQYRRQEIGEAEEEGIPSVLLCAGLLHDLGNPPFGHFGENTMAEWFKNQLGLVKYKGCPVREILSRQMVGDLEHFEGNAQTLRILAKSRYDSEINVSAAVISTLVKYPTNSLMFKGEDPDVKRHKPGYFFAEREALSAVSKIVGTQKDGSEIYRHPLTYMLEAADDIAYATADLEDAFEKGLFTLNEFTEFYESNYTPETAAQTKCPEQYSSRLINNLKDRRSKQSNDHKVFAEWIAYIRRWLMYVAVFRFSKSYDDIMCGSYADDLFCNTYHAKTIKILKDATRRFVFDSPGILKLELSAQTILSFLLGKFVNAALYHDYAESDFMPSKADKKYLSILPGNYKNDYQASRAGDEAVDLYLRLLMVTDYISSMTDSHARTLYRELSGIE
ncbi:MAG: deoxyguanosinetriphosphate triphosphohydrolase [Dehalococcoidia bacterium]|nr:deoxyguanosinetriphosphate triphosphohydrolase [Dehalococcoidia bacterium]